MFLCMSYSPCQKSFTAPAFPSLGLGSGAVTPREAARQAAAHDGRPLGSGAVTPMAAERQAAKSGRGGDHIFIGRNATIGIPGRVFFMDPQVPSCPPRGGLVHGWESVC